MNAERQATQAVERKEAFLAAWMREQDGQIANILRDRLLVGGVEPTRRERWLRWLYSWARNEWPLPEDL